MKAIDANIAIRWLTNDDPRQVALARGVMSGPVHISLTVLVEICWVLRRSYGFDRPTLNEAVTMLIDLANVSVPAEPHVRWALDRHAEGADLPDMLHLIAVRGTDAFVTFERRLAAKAGPNSPVPIEQLA